MPNNNIVVVHDTEYEMNTAYLQGALAFRDRIPNNCNPHRFGSMSYDQWDYGHVNESADEHFRFGIDLVTAPRRGTRFEMDPRVPRPDKCDVDVAWAALQRARLVQREPAFA